MHKRKNRKRTPFNRFSSRMIKELVVNQRMDFNDAIKAIKGLGAMKKHALNLSTSRGCELIRPSNYRCRDASHRPRGVSRTETPIETPQHSSLGLHESMGPGPCCMKGG